MKLVCSLEDFFLNHINVTPLDYDTDTKTRSGQFAFDYDLVCSCDDDHRIRMQMSFQMQASLEDEKSCCPYAIEAEIVGFFSFPQDLEDKQIAYLCRVNTMTILYGVLRGEIANITGSFVHGKFVLPTVMMPDIVTDIEEKKRLAEDEES